MKKSVLFLITGLIIIPSPYLLVMVCSSGFVSFLGNNDCGAWSMLLIVSLPAGLLVSLISGVVWFIDWRKTNNKNS